MSAHAATERIPLFDPTAPLSPTGNLRRRMIVSRAVIFGATGAAAIAVAALVWVIYGVISQGASVISLDFITTNASTVAGFDGGIQAALIGTVLIVAVASVIALPIAVLCALYLAEFAGPRSRLAAGLKLVLDLMQGLPTVVVGLFVFGVVVKAMGHESGFAGSIALAIVMLPLIARSSQEVLRLVPGSLREASDALGVARWRTTVGVVLPAAASGITTGAILAIARAAGETAPLLICDSVFQPGTTFNIFQGVPNIPVTMFELINSPSPEGLTRAWGAALVLLAGILVANVGARVLLARNRAKRGL